MPPQAGTARAISLTARPPGWAWSRTEIEQQMLGAVVTLNPRLSAEAQRTARTA